VLNIGFANLWEYESADNEKGGIDNLILTRTEEKTLLNNQK
jgi:hypothetical protein